MIVVGNYMKTIKFNFDGDLILLKLIGSSILGGLAYGGTFGFAFGAVYGPCLSIYMKF